MDQQENLPVLSLKQGINLSVLPPLLSREQFASFAGITADTVRGWIQSHTIPSVKIGRHRLVNVALIIEELQSGKKAFSQGDYQHGKADNL
jgi:excisionase family DNA binding protein